MNKHFLHLLAATLFVHQTLMAAGHPPDFHFPFTPPSQFSLFVEQGLVEHPVSTKRYQAQQYFNQGLTLIYAFNHDAAFWSFERATEIDPDLAMGYWGMALTLGSNINMEIEPENEAKVHSLIKKALSLAQQASKNEQAYIHALAQRYPATSDSQTPKASTAELAQAYFSAMKEVVAQFPEDLDALTLTAEAGLDLNPWNQYDSEGNPRPGTEEIVALLQTVLKRDPNHLGANHYYIHAVEASAHPEYALMSAERMRTLLPSSGHILHMPSHIYLLVGDYHKAAIANQEAVAADRAYIARFGLSGIYPLHYMSHNLYFLSRAYALEGRFEDALRASRDLAAFYNPHFDAMPALEYYASATLFVLLRFNQWQKILDLPAPNPEMKGTILLWRYGRTVAFTGLGNLEAAEKEQKIFEELKEQMPEKVMFGNNPMSVMASLANFVIQAKIAETRHDNTQAIELLNKAIEIQDEMRYSEPPDWFFPIREKLGAILLRSAKYEEAEKVFRKDLNRHPRNGRALFGLLISLKAQNKRNDAYWVEQQCVEAWRNSTSPLSLDNL
jgi:tetratricopeptide (TPR) repeat protein